MSSRWLAAGYPSKKRLTETERNSVLRTGPDLKWFEPWIEHGVVLPDAVERAFRYGYVHVWGGTEEPFQHDVHLFWDREGLSWALEHLHKEHPRCGDECRGLFYFAPDEPLRLRMVVEVDEEEDDEPGVAS